MADEGYSIEPLPVEQLLQALQGLTKMVKIYQANNQIVANCIQQLLGAAQALLSGHESVAIQLENSTFLINGEPLLRRKGATNALENFSAFLAERRISGFRILPVIITASPEELTGFAQLINGCLEQPDPAEWLGRQCRETGIGWITVSSVVAETAAEEEPLPETERDVVGRRDPLKVYAYTLRALRETAEKAAAYQHFGLRKAVRMVQAMVEEISSRESRLLVMSTVRDHSDQIFIHSVNVAILALSLGRELGLTPAPLERLGTCALLHDLGKVITPAEIMTRPGVLPEAEYARLQQHGLDSARLLLQGLVAPAPRKAEIMIPVFEHHFKPDRSGDPELGWRRSTSLTGRIIAVADAYDALTSARVYRRKPMSGDRALGLMRVGAGNTFEPLVLKAFIRMLGVYPVGTLLNLAGGETVLVSGPPPRDDLARPWAVALCDDGAGGLRRGEEINLAERDGAGSYRYQIVGSAHPSVRNIQPAQLLL